MTASADVAAPPRVLLVGMMGAGKSTTGHLLATELGWAYLDSDDEILRRTGRTVPEIWHADGEAAFRVEEAAVLADATSSAGPVVVGVAGGAVLDPDNRRRIAGAGLVVWLRVRLETLVARVGDGAGRPLLDLDPVAALTRLEAERRPVYAEIADVVVDVDGATPGEVVERIAAEVRRRFAGRHEPGRHLDDGQPDSPDPDSPAADTADPGPRHRDSR